MAQTCLIAAHDPWFIQLLRIYIEECGFRAVQAYESQDVLPMIYLEHPAAVLLQMDLPGPRNGYDLLQSIKSDPLIGRTPILLFSWHNSDGTEELADGASAYLQEPVTYEAFVDALRKSGICC